MERIERLLIPKFIEKLLTVMSKTTGRDKTFKLVQYFIRLNKVILFKNKRIAENPAVEELFNRLVLISSAMSLTRNAMRLARPFTSYSSMLRNFIKHVQNREDKSSFNKWRSLTYTVLKTTSDFGLMANFLFDHVVFLAKIGIIKNKKTRDQADLISNYFWLIDAIASFFADGYDIYLSHKEIKELEKGNEDGSQTEKIKEKKEILLDKFLTWFKNVIEFPTILYYINEDKFLNNETAYFLIVVSSIISIFSLWPST